MAGKPKAAPEREGSRAEIGRALEDKLSPEQLSTLLDEVLAITKHARGWCGTCKKHVQVEIKDARAVTGALTDLMSQAWGRPTETRQETEIIVKREVYLVAETEEEPHVSTE